MADLFAGLARESRELFAGPSRRFLLLKWAVCLGLLAELAMCPRLWTSDRPFPTLPGLESLPDLPAWLSLCLVWGLVTCVVAFGILPRPGWLPLVVVGLGFVLVLFDITRLQPWFWQYMLLFVALSVSTSSIRPPWGPRMVVPRDNIPPSAMATLPPNFPRVTFSPERAKSGPPAQPSADPTAHEAMGRFTKMPSGMRDASAVSIAGFVLAATYIWSGLQKINVAFAETVFPWFVHPLHLDMLRPLWFLAPMLEIATGVTLFLPRLRLIGLSGVVLLHSFLLAVLGPLGENANSVVWPWNIALPLIAFVVFFRNPEPILPLLWQSGRGKAIFLFGGVMPALNFFGLWDDYLSASLYSGKAPAAYLFLNQDGVRRLPPKYVKYVVTSPHRTALDAYRWSMAAMNVPPYSEERVFRQLARKLVALGVPAEDIELVVTDRPGLFIANPPVQAMNFR